MSGNIDENYTNNSEDENTGRQNYSDNRRDNFLYRQYSKSGNTSRQIELRNDISRSSEYPYSPKNKSDQACYVSPKRSQDKKDAKFICYLSDSDSVESVNYYISEKKRLVKQKKLPPIGVFWDIENCRIPKGRSAVSVAQLIRDLFFTGYREAEFIVVCDVKKESNQSLQELSDAQVFVVFF